MLCDVLWGCGVVFVVLLRVVVCVDVFGMSCVFVLWFVLFGLVLVD